ncbi:MAG: BTAD domain-containing putative transcriptional regulator, partial [Acidimicrobiia bacterium]
MEFRILGRLEVLDGGRELALGGHRQRAVLAILALSANRVVSVDRLIDDLWGEAPPARAVSTLHAYVSRLRHVLELGRPDGGPAEILVTRAPGYLLRVDAGDIDGARFELLSDEGHAALAAGDSGRAAAVLAQALALWRGGALADFAGEAFARPEIARLEERRLAALEGRMEAALALGRHPVVVGELEHLVAAHPLRERLHGLLMLALYRSGRQAEALRAYQNTRAFLGEELGIEPGPALRALEQAVILQDPELDWRPPAGGRAVPTEPAPRARHHLPVAISSFVGRRRELAVVAEHLRAARLVTITGLGGAGKTRLAVEAASGLLGSFPDGVFLVELAPLCEPGLVASEVATTLGIGSEGLAGGGDGHHDPAAGGVVEALCRHLGARRVLLVLDNCEQLVAAVATLCARLLPRCPDLKVLATSREPLGLPGEVAWPIPALSQPAPEACGVDALGDADAVALFVERARAADPGFAITEENAPAVVQICRRLDGIPLALELAASRLRLLSPKQVAERLDDRFRLLTGGPRFGLPRYGTLLASIDWSYDLLGDAERRLFERLSAFPAGFSLAAAEAVGTDGTGLEGAGVLELLGQLVEKSLVTLQRGGDDVRYHLLETVREYGRHKLAERGDTEVARRRHRDFFLRLATRHGLHAVDHPGEWMHGLAVDHDNFRAALDWSFAVGETGAALALAAGLSTYCQFGGHFIDGRAWLEQALADGGAADGPARVAALNGLGYLVLQQGDPTRAVALHEQARAQARSIGDEGGEAMACLFLGARALQEKDVKRAESLFANGRRGFESAGSAGGVGWCEFHLGWSELARGRHGPAADRFGYVLDLGRTSGRDDLAAHAAAALAPLAALADDAGRAEELAGEA